MAKDHGTEVAAVYLMTGVFSLMTPVEVVNLTKSKMTLSHRRSCAKNLIFEKNVSFWRTARCFGVVEGFEHEDF